MTSIPWVLYIVTAFLSMIWAASEVISAFEATPVRALVTRGAWLLMLTNAFFACLALMVTLELAPNRADSLLTAFAVGFGWQALVRSQISVFRPLPGEPSGQGLVVPVDQVYGRVQEFVRRSIDQSLARDRTQLLEQALALDVETLKRQVQLMSYGLSEMDPQQVQNWLREMESRSITDYERKMLLASKLIETSGAHGAQQFITRQVQEAKQADTSAGPTPAPVTSEEVSTASTESGEREEITAEAA